MATNYTGTPFPPIGQDNPPPLPGAAPIVSIPVDADPNNVATMFTDQYRMIADHQAHMSAALRARAPIAPFRQITGFGYHAVGFTSVVNSGVGSGTISPAEVTITSGDARVAIKISTAGGLGVGFFRWSNDAGATYGVATLIPAPGTYTDPTSQIAVIFAGTFTLNDVYSFQPTDTPILYRRVEPIAIDAPVISHDGSIYPTKRFVADWSAYGTSGSIAATANPITEGFRPWGCTIVGGTSSIVPGSTMTTSASHVGCSLSVGGSAGNRVSVQHGSTFGYTLGFTNGLITTLEFEFNALTTYTTPGLRFFCGFGTPVASDLGASATSWGLLIESAASPIVAIRSSGATIATTIPVTLDQIHSVKLELHRPFTPCSLNGTVFRVFYDGLQIFSRSVSGVVGLPVPAATYTNVTGTPGIVFQLGDMIATIIDHSISKRI